MSISPSAMYVLFLSVTTINGFISKAFIQLITVVFDLPSISPALDMLYIAKTISFRLLYVAKTTTNHLGPPVGVS